MNELLRQNPDIRRLPGESDSQFKDRMAKLALAQGNYADIPKNKSMTGLNLDVKVPPGMEGGASEEEFDAAAQSMLLQGRDKLGPPLITVDTKPKDPLFSLLTGNLDVTKDPYTSDKESLGNFITVEDMGGEITGEDKKRILLGLRSEKDQVNRDKRREELIPTPTPAKEESPTLVITDKMRSNLRLPDEEEPDVVEKKETITKEAAVEPKESSSFFGKIGQLIKNNPEVAAQIAQLGGGLLSNVAQGKAQRKADKATEERMARANLIGALTGRTPGVAEERADTGGFLSLDTLGKAIAGGGKVVSDEMTRRRAEEVEERTLGQTDEKLEIAREDMEKDFEVAIKEAEAALAEASGVDYPAIQKSVDSIDRATQINVEGGYLDPKSGGKALYDNTVVVFEEFLKDPGPIGNAAIFQQYQRFFDPATVRVEDAKMVAESQGLFKKLLEAPFQRMTGEGGIFANSTVREMYDLVEKVHNAKQLAAMDQVNAYIGTEDQPGQGLIDPRYRNRVFDYYKQLIGSPTDSATDLSTALENDEINL